jgi:cholest-4-en-3-one 26-monooxygenase
MLALFQHPDQRQRLLADPALIPAAAEEIVHWVSPISQQRRTAICETELGGQKIAEGDKVVMFFSSANRDESIFADPQEFDIGRDPKPHLGFGHGNALLPRPPLSRARTTDTPASHRRADARHHARR